MRKSLNLSESDKTEDKISIYKLDTPEEILNYYKKWSSDNNYEKDLENWLYLAPQVCCNLFNDLVLDKNTHILDAGCGTGLVGKILQDQKHTNIDGLDFSKEMLNLIPKGIYKKKFQADLNKPLTVSDKYYDHALCVGTFTYGHVKSNSFDEFHRILKKDGYFIFSINEGVYQLYGFDKAIQEFEKQGKWKIISLEKKSYIEKKSIDAYYVVVQIKK